MNASAPAAITKYSGTSRFDVFPPAWIGMRKGKAMSIAPASSAGRLSTTNAAAATAPSATSAPAAAASGWRCTMSSCGECQMSASSSTGASTSAPSIASA